MVDFFFFNVTASLIAGELTTWSMELIVVG